MITETGLQVMATAMKESIVKVVLNETAEVLEFDLEEVEGVTYNLRFFVPQGVSRIIRLQLLNTGGDILGDYQLFAEIETTAIFRYVLKFTNAR